MLKLGGEAAIIWHRARRSRSTSELRERAADPREHFFFAENFEKVIQARAGVAAGCRESRRMDERADFDAKICGGGFEC